MSFPWGNGRHNHGLRLDEGVPENSREHSRELKLSAQNWPENSVGARGQSEEECRTMSIPGAFYVWNTGFFDAGPCNDTGNDLEVRAEAPQGTCFRICSGHSDMLVEYCRQHAVLAVRPRSERRFGCQTPVRTPFGLLDPGQNAVLAARHWLEVDLHSEEVARELHGGSGEQSEEECRIDEHSRCILCVEHWFSAPHQALALMWCCSSFEVEWVG
eukprot:gene9722-biopygen4727